MWAVSALAQPSGTGTATVIERAVLAASCSQAHVQTAIDAATDGDTVLIPAGSCTWGTSGTFVAVNKAIIVRGAGRGVTNIDIASTSSSFSSGAVRLTAAATVRGFTITTSVTSSRTAFSAATNGFRITDIEYVDQSAVNSGYFLYTGAYGLVDNNSITGALGDMELIFARGPTDSWQTAHSMGGADNLFIENNMFGGSGYVCDCNSNSRCVVRYNTITGNQKIDGHGKASNTPARGVRHMEIYNNLWTSDALYWTAMELRGGSGRVFDNVSQATGTNRAYIGLTEYGSTSAWFNFGSVCQCPSDYPIDDQIGVGIDPKSAASEPMYLWGNIRNGVEWIRNTYADTSACTATCGGTFAMTDIVQAERDYFMSASKPAAMSGYTPYTCPHPSAGAGACGSTAGRAGYSVSTP